MRTFRYVIADVFTDTPLAGNQLAVFTDARDLDPLTMQALALELGFSESVFVLPPAEGGHVRIRIFTPQHELPFAGHPTLGTAFVLGAPLQLDVIRLETGARDRPGCARARRVGADRLRPDDAAGADRRRRSTGQTELLAALGVERSELPVELYDNGVEHVYVALGSEEEVAALGPTRARSRAFGFVGANSFAGVGDALEDAHVLAARRRRRGRGDRLGGRAARVPPRAARPGRRGARRSRSRRAPRSAGRRRSTPRAAGADGEIEAVEVGGSAVTVARGEFRLP